MKRIISDTYSKKEKATWGDDPNDTFNKRVLAVNGMYGWLYERGILENVSFIFKDYAETTYFSLDAQDLVPFRKEMESSGVNNAAIAVHHIFDEAYTPCTYSGAIEPGWTMFGYRDVDGCVSRSWECSLAKHLNNDSVYDIYQIKEERGIKAAVMALYSKFDWNPPLYEKKPALDNLVNHAANSNQSKPLNGQTYEGLAPDR